MMSSSTSLGVPPFPIKEGKRMDADWAELPQEIVVYISKRLTIYIDYLRFRCVCRTWNYHVPKIPLHLPPQLPWLMLSDKTFFDLSTNKLHRLNLPSFSHQTLIIGSSHGWLVILDGYGEVHLLNPIICATVSLPSLRTFPELVRMLFLDHSNIYLIKVILSPSPSLNKDFAALAILSTRNLAFCRKGYDSWVLFNVNENHRWIDAVYKNGLFYAVSMIGTIAVCDVEGPSISIIETTISTGSWHRVCYVMFSGEDMLMVARDFTMDYLPQLGRDPDVWTVGFVIYKLNWNLLKWEEIQTLGEHSLFIGKNYSLSFYAADFVGCCSNCIYFTDDLAGKRDFGIYSLSDERVEPLPCNPQNSYCRFGCPIWVTPNPQ